MRPRNDDSTLVYSSENPGHSPERKERGGRSQQRPSTKTSSAGSASSSSSPSKADGIVRVWLERKGRNGKPVSIIRGLTIDDGALTALASRLKRVCGTGGSAKHGEIIIQGDHRSRIATELERDGHRVKLAGG